MSKYKELLETVKKYGGHLVVYNDPKGGSQFFRISRCYGLGGIRSAVEGAGIAKMYLQELQRAGARIDEYNLADHTVSTWATLPPAKVIKPIPAAKSSPYTATDGSKWASRETFNALTARSNTQQFTTHQLLEKAKHLFAAWVTPYVAAAIRDARNQKGRGK